MKSRGRLAAILPLGDLQYPRGEYHDFLADYDPTWGVPELRALTRPVPGNHEYGQGLSDASGYFDYFNGVGVATGPAGVRGAGYYSYDLGDWHFVALNTSDGCQQVSCRPGGAMHTWLLRDLAANRRPCLLAYWHYPRFVQGAHHGDDPRIAPLWDALYDAGADLVLTGHEHSYQELAPMDKEGQVDPAHGVRTFVVGTGGARLYGERPTTAHATAVETRRADRYGVLELTLGPRRYEWRFLAADGTPGGDPISRGRGVCHR